MHTKLTLNIDDNIIELAKKYAKRNKISLSKMIENYLSSVTESTSKNREISHLVESLTGVITLKENDDKKQYLDYLTKKYS